MVDIHIHARLLRILREGQIKAYHYRCGGEVKLYLDTEYGAIICDACNASGIPMPRVDDNDSIVIIQNTVQVCFDN